MNKYVWDAYAPFQIGFDDVFKSLETLSTKPINYPPYNFIQKDSSTYEVQVALAGFTEDEVKVYSESGILYIASELKERNTKVKYIHQGIAKRAFSHEIILAEELLVEGIPTFDNGLLVITLKKNIPEHHKRKDYTIGRSSNPEFLNE